MKHDDARAWQANDDVAVPAARPMLPAAAFQILLALAEEDLHGYAIMRQVEEQTAGSLRLGPGTLYGAITRLEQRGWIRPVASDDRRQPYALTPAGREYLKDQLENLDRVVKAGLRRLRHA